MNRNPLIRLIVILGVFLLGEVIFTSCHKEETERKHVPDFRNFYGIVWNETKHQNLNYARQMGYDYVFYQPGMESDTLSNGFYFYLETPEYMVYSRYANPLKEYSAEEKAFYENNCVIGNIQKEFPGNIATGWYLNENNFTALLDFQQQRVITWVTDSILAIIDRIEEVNPLFHFGGFAWDCPVPTGDFWTAGKPYGKLTDLRHWTGGDYGYCPKDQTHDFETFSEGRLSFFQQMIEKARIKHPDLHVIMEPDDIYEEWINPVLKSRFANVVLPDILSQEKFGTEFVEDKRITDSGLISAEYLASTTSDRFSEADNRLIAATSAINGAWFSWYGSFGGMGDMPYFRKISEVPARLKLIRMLANWENLNGTPLEERKWDGRTYQSPTAYVTPDAISILQPFTKKLFVVFITEKGEVPLPKGKKIESIYKADPLFYESEDGTDDLQVRKKIIKSNIQNDLNRGYIIHLE